jgi:hypothetical protein
MTGGLDHRLAAPAGGVDEAQAVKQTQHDIAQNKKWTAESGDEWHELAEQGRGARRPADGLDCGVGGLGL